MVTCLGDGKERVRIMQDWEKVGLGQMYMAKRVKHWWIKSVLFYAQKKAKQKWRKIYH